MKDLIFKRTAFNTIFVFVSALLVIGTLREVQAQQTGNATITVNIIHVKERKGNLDVALFNRPEDFPMKLKNAFATKRIILTSLESDTALHTLSVTFSGLQPGIYAIAVHHDKNANGKVDTNFLGIPREPVGCSNNPHGHMRAPHFDEAQFTVAAQESKTLSIEVK